MIPHGGGCCLHTDSLGGVDGKVDGLVADAQAVEFGGIVALLAESKRAVLFKFHRVDFHRAVKSDVLQIEHGVFGLGNVAVDVELSFGARGDGQHGQRKGRNRQQSGYFHVRMTFVLFCMQS